LIGFVSGFNGRVVSWTGPRRAREPTMDVHFSTAKGVRDKSGRGTYSIPVTLSDSAYLEVEPTHGTIFNAFVIENYEF
jgi:hypothetical protein